MATPTAPRIPSLHHGQPLYDSDGKRLVVKKTIGRGGLGVVYQADHDAFGNCAIKVTKKLNHCTDIIAEARWVCGMRVPGAVPVLGIGTFPVPSFDSLRIPFIIMPLYRQTMDKALHDIQSPSDANVPAKQGFPAEQIAAWVLSISRALRRLRILHRDIKPENIFLQDDGTAVIGDFGLAVPWDADERDRSKVGVGSGPCGTPDYMSPEQFCVAPNIDQRSDIYSLGLLMYELSVGKPFRKDKSGDHLTAMCKRLLNNEESGTGVGFSIDASAVPDARLRRIITCAGKAVVAERYQDHSDLIADLMPLAMTDQDADNIPQQAIVEKLAATSTEQSAALATGRRAQRT